MSQTAKTKTIPIIDIFRYVAGDREGAREIAEQIDHACRSVGFLVITGHGIDTDFIQEMRAVTMRFFGLESGTKFAYKMPPDRYRGYTSPGTESLAASYGQEAPPDLKESFSIGPVDVPQDEYHSRERAGAFFADNQWPTEIPEMRDLWSRYYREMELLSTRLMRLFAIALGLSENFFDDKVDKHITNMSAIHYPPLTEAPKPGQMRGGAHTDFGSLTIVQRDQAPGGLQVLIDGDWINAPYVDNSFVINIGDLMAEWTNDRWVSTIHQVGLPERLEDAMSDRLSLIFFHQPNYDAEIAVLESCCGPGNPAKYEPTTSGAHIAKKIAAMRSPELGS
ncbi:MAG: isopenicillin N synthase family oxygenase [Actinomycetota bacterium]|nr:isopenicillin N synthase family oxygenase [Actinomycetota bacterium]